MCCLIVIAHLSIVVSIFHFLSIDRDATVWTDDGAGGASCAGIGVCLLHIAVTTTVNHLVCERNDVERTGDDTE